MSLVFTWLDFSLEFLFPPFQIETAISFVNESSKKSPI
jgi:hypothetical protein